MGRYDPLTEAVRAAAARGQATVELGFGQIEEITGRPLPASSDQRQWWANTAHSQALACRAAGFHVEQVYLDHRRVRFARGEVGGYADRGRIPTSPSARGDVAPPEGAPAGPPVDVRVRLQQTSLRVNALLRAHLAAGGDVALAVATVAAVWFDGEEPALDLTRKAARLLAENAALLRAQLIDDAEIVNLG
jgi:hypothetical protein